MPDYSRWPIALDVEVLFKSAAYWPKGTPESAKNIYAKEQATIGTRAAARAVDELTGHFPFLSPSDGSVAHTITINRSIFQGSGIIRLNNGLLRLDSLTLNGQALPNNQVIPMPSEAPMQGRPYTYLLLPMHKHLSFGSYQPLQAEVAGHWGFCRTAPEDLWSEVLQYAAVKTLSNVENAQSIASISQDGFSKSYDIVGILTQKDLAGEQGIWGRSFRAAIEQYKRRV